MISPHRRHDGGEGSSIIDLNLSPNFRFQHSGADRPVVNGFVPLYFALEASGGSLQGQEMRLPGLPQGLGSGG